MRTPLIAGNWKMHMDRPRAVELIQELKQRLDPPLSGVHVMVAPPFTALHAVADSLEGTGWFLGAQNAFWKDEGPYTGEISVPMLAELGCRFVILGHSERREHFGETDEVISRKVSSAMRHRITPILCVGESLAQREDGLTIQVVEAQLEGALGGLSDAEAPEWVIAYEPIWAIGTGRTATPEQAQEVHEAIRRWLGQRFSRQRADSTRILYGGSVKPDNIDALMAQPDIDGALVGGASLKAEAFARIVAFRG